MRSRPPHRSLRPLLGPAFGLVCTLALSDGPPSGKTGRDTTWLDAPELHPSSFPPEDVDQPCVTAGSAADSTDGVGEEPFAREDTAARPGRIFPRLTSICHGAQLPCINMPGFGAGPIPFNRTAVAWFGHLDEHSNWADLRVGYNTSGLYVYIAVYDRHLWYDPSPTVATLTRWDAVTLLLDTDGAGVRSPTAWRFVGQLYGEPSPERQAVWQGSAEGWQISAVPFTAHPGWRGNALNDNSETDRGWAMGFTIPFSSLGLSASPPTGTTWRMAIILHDRDSLEGPPFPEHAWPPAAQPFHSACWGRLHFGLPSWHETRPVAGTVTIRRPNENSPSVPDADVGGSTGNQCPGDEYHIWNQWANLNWGFRGDFNVQNQSDVADWPCFARYYITFPLTDVPRNKRIVSATLILHQFGNSGGPTAPPSWIQVLTVDDDWDEGSITWNNAPPAHENVGGAWVEPIVEFPGWPGVPRSWDVSYAVARAYELGQPVRLVLYSADSDYHTGKYFVSSDTGDWNAEGRPTLVVRWADP